MIRTNKQDFIAAHGKAPRGTGEWWISIGGNDPMIFRGTFSSAVKAAKAEGIKSGFKNFVITIQP